MSIPETASSYSPIEEQDQGQRYDNPRKVERDWRGSWRANWRADYVLLAWSLPLVLAFIPPSRDLMKEGFAVLQNDVPAWYVQLGGIIVAGIFGFRKIFNLAELHMKTKLAEAQLQSSKDTD